ncbi:MAG TPA: trigger factor [Pyrinomonadaceae bacterium]
MKTEIVDVSPTRKELKIEIGADEVRAEVDEVSRRYAAQANVPGFRKGHTPVSVVRTRFKKEIAGDVVQNLVPRAVNEAIMESGLHVIGEPEIHLDPGEGLSKMGEAPLAVHAHVEVLPEVSLGEYRGLEATRRTRPVTDEMIEEFVAGLREQSAALVPVEDRASQEGDTVTVDFTGRHIDPPAEEDIKAEEVDVVIGGEGVLPVFAENLTGVRPEDVRTFTVKYPEDFSSKGLAGKEIEYTATVTAVRRKELPEADDDWARSLGEGLESVDDLRGRLREQLGARATFESDQRLRDELMAKLTDAHRFELPDSLVEYQSRQILERTVRDMMQRGMDPRGQDINWEGLQNVMRARAEDELRGSLLLERIAEAEDIEPTDEEIAQEIESIAAGTRQTPEQVRAALTKQGGERSIADRLRHRKALDVIVESARVTDGEWRDETPAAEQAETPSSDDASAEAAKGGE